MATPKKTPSRAELTAQKIALVRKMIENRATVYEIKESFSSRFRLSKRSAEAFIQLVYRMLRQETDKPIPDHRVDSLLEYRKILKDPDARPIDKIRAQERIDKILGLEASIRIESVGSVSVTETARLTPAEERELVEKILNSESDNAAASTGDQARLPSHAGTDGTIECGG
jgi:hypothetical protein